MSNLTEIIEEINSIIKEEEKILDHFTAMRELAAKAYPAGYVKGLEAAKEIIKKYIK